MPNPDWEKFVVTHKAKAHIRRWVREEERKAVDEGREIWEKRSKRAKLTINDDDLLNFLHLRKLDNMSQFFLGIKQEGIDPDEIIRDIQEAQKHPQPVPQDDVKIDGLFDRYLDTVRDGSAGIMLEGSRDSYMHNFAKCCHPIPGDEVVGFVTTGEGIKIHRRSCKNLKNIMQSSAERIVDVSWPSDNGSTYVSGVRISGEDRPGMLNDVTHAISTYMNTNIRSVSIDSQSGMFDGMFVLDVQNTEHLSRILDRLVKIKGVKRADRFDE
jgi:(p)ppGpp synthase/HD superfamily hydrolase